MNKKILVVDVPAVSGGALSILYEFYNKAINDKEKDWIFVVSRVDLKETTNVKVIKIPWTKNSWLHRLYFDKFVVRKLASEYKVDEVLSLQNVIFPNIQLKQTMYLHQSLPFSEKRYSLLKSPKLWIYQNVIGKLIVKSIKEADEIIVQAFWMKELCSIIANVPEEKFRIEKPQFEIDIYQKYKEKPELTVFFYPANEMEYKNHQIIIDAVKNIQEKYRDFEKKEFKVTFTLTGNENKVIKKIYKEVNKNNLPVEFIGPITLAKVYEYYSYSILVFPSLIETVGLPLLEARSHNTPIIAANLNYAIEALDNYKNVEYFHPESKQELETQLVKYL